MTRWGILATGGIAARFVEDLQLLPDAEVLAVGSRSVASAQAFADRYGIPRAYGSWDELAADGDVDVVYVATPHSAHHAATMTCLAAGRAVLCEKPFTLDLASSTELVETARARDVFLMEAMWMRCNPTVRRVCELIDDGAIGEVVSVHADFGLAGPFAPESRMRDRALGGGALLDLGIYPVSLAHLVLGRPDSVRSWAKLTPEGVDQNTGVLLGYESGAVAALTCGIVGATPVTATITGSTGRISLPDPFICPSEFTLRRGTGDPEVVRVVEPAGNGYQYEAAEVHRCLAAGLRESPLVPHAVSLEVMELLDTIRGQIGVSYD
ncbi:Gfo/Idh/MocA family oxidoreductase [Solwaraspora sp. WMMA2080]|uniref:Gfo/Idh/MocA family protein n=1 Tax=unclassified Solwaraspora TaxID=2627926 RepID=UPI00248B8EED|nr:MULTISPECIES: Gfo/Idh/MocA family oxidoreductase [unclassified Solwaraspora]WBB97551.1 Gfo/Idh/MocA family oxidoreductase [Solwaraspora sp. WMMA2059]WBC18556.1 Gfo/Idh/MocA family oxidoreductase [Solwaraspora sp. WMMA2080]